MDCSIRLNFRTIWIYSTDGCAPVTFETLVLRNGVVRLWNRWSKSHHPSTSSVVTAKWNGLWIYYVDEGYSNSVPQASSTLVSCGHIYIYIDKNTRTKRCTPSRTEHSDIKRNPRSLRWYWWGVEQGNITISHMETLVCYSICYYCGRALLRI